VKNLMDSFFDLDQTATSNEYNATLILTKTMYHTVTSTVSEIVTMAASSPSIVTSSAMPKTTALDMPHFPRVDMAFTAIFGTCCLFLLLGVVLRNKMRKIKSFNIPVILGSFCIPLRCLVNDSQCAWTLSSRRQQLHQQEI